MDLAKSLFLLTTMQLLGGMTRADVLFSNLNQTPTDMEAWKTTNIRFATDFLTANSGTIVTGVTMSLFNSSPDNHNFTASIFNDVSGAPGPVLIGSFDVFSVPGNQTSVANFSTTSPGLSLAANTPYWLTLQINENITVPGVAGWREDSGQATDAGTLFATVSSTDTKYSSNSGASYSDFFPGNFHYSITGNVPEPTTGALFLAGFLLAGARRGSGRKSLRCGE
jgi:hypothetical protein